MVSYHPQPEEAPSFDGLTDEEVLRYATMALTKVNGYQVGSLQRTIQWAVYEEAKAELDMRLYRHILQKIRQRKDS